MHALVILIPNIIIMIKVFKPLNQINTIVVDVITDIGIALLQLIISSQKRTYSQLNVLKRGHCLVTKAPFGFLTQVQIINDQHRLQVFYFNALVCMHCAHFLLHLLQLLCKKLRHLGGNVPNKREAIIPSTVNIKRLH